MMIVDGQIHLWEKGTPSAHHRQEPYSMEQALAGKLSVAEGVASAPAVRQLAAKLGVDVPICGAVAAILAGEADVDAAIAGLLSRPLREEN